MHLYVLRTFDIIYYDLKRLITFCKLKWEFCNYLCFIENLETDVIKMWYETLMPSQTNLAAFTFDHVFYYRQYSDRVTDPYPISLVTLLLQFWNGVRDTRLNSTNHSLGLKVSNHIPCRSSKKHYTHSLLQTWSFGPFWSSVQVSRFFMYLFIGRFQACIHT